MSADGSLRVALAQVDPVVGDVAGNRDLVLDWIERAKQAGADVVVFPELVLSGYPPDDLLLRPDFLNTVRRALEEIADTNTHPIALVGFPEALGSGDEEGAQPHSPVQPLAANSLAVIREGRIDAVYRKQILPNYGVFDEQRVFQAGTETCVIELDGGIRAGLTICEDAWVSSGPSVEAAAGGAEFILNASASPFAKGKAQARDEIVSARSRETGLPVLLCNMVGGQDELVFDGGSVACDGSGEIVARSVQFAEDLLIVDIENEESMTCTSGSIAPKMADLDEIYAALSLGLSDYAVKNGFESVVLGLSGGIDSAFVAQLAVDSLGPESVVCVVMPSPHSSQETQADARSIAENLGCRLIEIPIESAMEVFDDLLSGVFDEDERGLAEENLQARIRGNLVMALSNKFGWLALATGNKSEMAVGYATLYGDMAGGFAPIKDVPKTLVYELVENRQRTEADPCIPESVVARAPSAELRPDQKDSDSLPDYSALDRVLELYVERDLGRDAMIDSGLEPGLVDEVIRLVDRAEYKRRQAPPGTRISSKAFGRERRLPITNRYSGLDPLPR